MSDAKQSLQQGRLLRQQGDFAAAFEWLEKAIRLDPESAEICKELARCSLAVNELRAFTNWSHEAMRIDPADPEPHLLMADVLDARNRPDEAAEERRIASLLKPNP